MNLPADNKTPETPHTPPKGGRRRMLQMGLTLAPWALTLSARPVLGAQCIAPSQTLSGALSHAAQKVGECNGRAVHFYRDNPGSWGLAFPEPTTLFYNIFFRPAGTTLYVKPDGTSFTLLEVLQAPPGPGSIGYHIVGAYLNIAAGLVDPIALDITALLQIWTQYATNGYYLPFPWNPSVQWLEPDIVNYLVNNAIAPNSP